MKRSPTRRDGLETRARLLRAARETFEERGYHRTSVAEICRRCSVANGTFYRYFNNKDEVFLLLARQLQDELEAVLTDRLHAEQTLTDKIYNAQIAFYSYVSNNRALYQIFREAEFVHINLPVQTYHGLAKTLGEHLFPEADAKTAITGGSEMTTDAISGVTRAAVPFAMLAIANMLAMKYIIWRNENVPADVIAAAVDFVTLGLSPTGSRLPVREITEIVEAVQRMKQEEIPSAAPRAPNAGDSAADEWPDAFDDVEPRLTDGERTRRRLLRAAELMFGRQGFFGTQIVDITQRAGVAQGTFYVHFEGKTEILRELVRDISRRLRQGLRAGVEAAAAVPNSDRRHVEIGGLAAFLRWLDGREGIYRIVREAEFVDETIAITYYDELVRGYASALASAASRGEIRPVPVETLAYALLALGHGSGLRWVLWPKETVGRVPDNIDEVVHALAKFILYGAEGMVAHASAPL